MGMLIDADRLKEVFSRNVAGGNAYFDLIDNASTVEAIPKDQYENRLKADMVAMLTDLQLDIEESENCGKAFYLGLQMASNIIQQKINELPPVTPQEPRKGHWILDETDNSITCDKCGCLIWANDISNGEAYFCPNCGIKMESVDDNAT